MITINEVSTLLDGGGDVVGPDGDRLGHIGQVYLDDATGDPAWVTVRTGLFGHAETFVPLEEATAAGTDITVPYDRQRVHDAPRIDADGSISPQEEIELYSYYGILGYGDDAEDAEAAATGRPSAGTGPVTGVGVAEGSGDGQRGTAARDTSGAAPDDAMTVSEESLRVGKQVREAGRARLRKFVVTQEQSVTVPVRHEELRVEREPITGTGRDSAPGGSAFTEEVHEIVLHEEVPVVAKEVRPVERVRGATEVVEREQHISGPVRKEQVELETEAVADPASPPAQS